MSAATPPRTKRVKHGSAAAPLANSPRAFSLIELVVAVGIIVVLVGLLVATVAALTRGSEKRQSEDMLTLLDRALDEWEKNAERSISFGKDGEPLPASIYEIQSDVIEPYDADAPGSDDHEPTDDLLDIIRRDTQSKSVLATIGPKFLKPPSAATGHDDLQVMDSWDTEIITIFPGRTWTDAFDGASGTERDPDGTIRTAFENALGVCPSKQIVFVSAGPDGKFGDKSAADGTPARAAAEDNLYSQPVEAP